MKEQELSKLRHLFEAYRVSGDDAFEISRSGSHSQSDVKIITTTFFLMDFFLCILKIYTSYYLSYYFYLATN